VGGLHENPHSANRLARAAGGPPIARQNIIQSQHKELIMAIDPVCGMEVDERSTTDKATYQGQMYYFCSKDCKDEFQADPGEYIGEEKTGT